MRAMIRGRTVICALFAMWCWLVAFLLMNKKEKYVIDNLLFCEYCLYYWYRGYLYS